MTSPFTLAACAELLFVERSITERVKALHDLGFAAEIWDWTRHDIDELAALCEQGVVFTSMTGYVTGDLTTADGSADLLRTAEQSIPVAKQIGAQAMNLHGTGLAPGGLPVSPVDTVTGTMWLAARDTLCRIAELGERAGVCFVLENLNTRLDHPGTPFASSEDTLALVAAVDSPHLRMNLDLYHVQIDEGNLTQACRRSVPWIGEVQIADVPGRCEPGTGEINYPHVARVLAEAGYAGVVGFEGHASGDPELALERFREAFTR